MVDEQTRGLGTPTRRQFLGMGGMALGGMALAACGAGSGTATTAAPAPATTAGSAIPTTTKSAVTVGYNNPNRLLRSPLYVGQTLGFFEEVGITDLTINDADDPVPPTLSGDYDIALFDSDVYFDAMEKGVLDGGSRMVAVNLGAQPLILIANEGVTAENLAGKTVGGGREGQVNEAICKYMLGELGLDWETDVNFVSLTGGSNDWVQAMLTGQIDATIAFSRHVPLAEADGGSALFSDFFNAPQGGFVMTADKMAEDEGFAAAWCYAYIQAHRWVKTRDNFDELVRILSEEHGIDLPDAFFDPNVYEIDATILSQDLGFDPAEMDTWMDFVAPFGNVPADINDRWRNYVDVSGLHVAQEALGLPANPAADLSSGKELIANF